jgi:cytochrome c oxidase subunit 2
MTNPPGGRGQAPVALLIAIVLIAGLAVLTIVSGFTVLQPPKPVTEQAKDTETLYQVTLVLALVIFFLVSAGIIWAIFRYRRRGPGLPPQVHGSSTLEIGWTIVPLVILVALFIPSMILVVDLKTPVSAEDADVTIEVMGQQWYWTFTYCQAGDCARTGNLVIQRTPPAYPDYGESDALTRFQPPTIVVPVGETVLFKVRSRDVVHSFYVPHFYFKIQAIPGNVNDFSIRVTEPGVYSGHCVQFCGLRHSDMLFIVDAREPAEYQRWLTRERQARGLPPEDALSAEAGR